MAALEELIHKIFILITGNLLINLHLISFHAEIRDGLYISHIGQELILIVKMNCPSQAFQPEMLKRQKPERLFFSVPSVIST